MNFPARRPVCVEQAIPGRAPGRLVAGIVSATAVAVAALWLATPAANAAASPAPRVATPTTSPASHPTTPAASQAADGQAVPSPQATPPGIGLGSGAPTPAAPSTSTGGGSVDGGGTYHPGLFDVAGHIRKAINDWFSGLVTAAFTPILDLLARTLLTTPQLTSDPGLHSLWLANLGIADGLLVLLILAGGATVMGYETFQTRLAAKELAPRIVVAAVAANVSLPLLGLAISLADALARAVLAGTTSKQAVSGISKLILGSLAGNIFLTLVGAVVAVLAAMLLATWLLRLVLVVLLVIAAPLALVCHALPATEGLAKLWWRATAGTLVVQVAQSLALVTALRVFLPGGGLADLGLSAGGGLVNLLVAGCLCWVMIRIPAWTSRQVFSSHGGGGIGRSVKQLVVYKAIRAIGAAAL
jgi:hypothetical protein